MQEITVWRKEANKWGGRKSVRWTCREENQFRLSIENKVDKPESTAENFNRQFQLGKIEKEAVEWAWPHKMGITMFYNKYLHQAAKYDGLIAEPSFRLQLS